MSACPPTESRSPVDQCAFVTTARPVPPGAAPDLARLAELYERSVLLDRCAPEMSRTVEGASRLSAMRRRLLFSMRAAGLPESRWFRVRRLGLYLEPVADPARPSTDPAYRLHAAPWAAVRHAPPAEPPVLTLGRARGAGRLVAACLSAYVRWLARISGSRGERGVYARANPHGRTP